LAQAIARLFALVLPYPVQARTLAWLSSFIPAPMRMSHRECLLACMGAGLCLFSTEVISRLAWGTSVPWFIAPMGAIAILLFVVPSSPLAQPWSVIGGNLIAGVVGVTCAHWIAHPGVATAVATAVAIGLMVRMRCLHPPSGAVAAMAVLGGPEIIELGYGFVLWPVLANSLVMLAIAIVFNSLMKRGYPYRAAPAPRHGTSDPPAVERTTFTEEDLSRSLEEHAEFIDVNPHDLKSILATAELHAWERRHGALRCADIMSRDVVQVRPDTSVTDARRLLHRHRFNALPVVNPDRTLAGMIAMHNLLLDPDSNPEDAERRLLGSVGDVMKPAARCARPDHSIAELVPLFAGDGLHHVPVVDDSNIVVGMLTQTDLLAAMFREGLAA
jgi:CBS domain-containing membrane protein